MKANQTKVEILENATSAGLMAAVNTFLDGLGESSLLSVEYEATYNGGGITFSALISYTE